MARVLHVDKDAAARAELHDVIAERGHEVVDVADANEALSVAGSSGVDLVVCDVRVEGMPAPELRKKLRRSLASFPIPFIFTSVDVRADSAIVMELAAIEYLILFPKPLDQAKFGRTVDALIGSEALIEGRFGDAALDAMLKSIETGEDSGVLTAYRGTIVKKVAFEHGKVTFCGSNDPKERIGHALIKAGVITEEDLTQALGVHEGSVSSLTAVLEKLGKATPKQIDDVAAKKIREAVLELYLWNEGKWAFQGGALAVSNPSRISLDIGPIRVEGNKRAPRWKAVSTMFPSEEIRFDVATAKFPAGFPGNAGDKKLVDLAQKGLSLGQIRLELPGQDYAVFVRLFELVKMGVLEKRGITGPGPLEADQIAERFALAAAAAKSTGARAPAPDLPAGLRPAASEPAPAAPPPRMPASAPAPTLNPLNPDEVALAFAAPLPLDEVALAFTAPLPSDALEALTPAKPIVIETLAPPPPASGPPPPPSGGSPMFRSAAPPPPPEAPPPPPMAPPPPPVVEPAADGDPVWAMLHEAETDAALREILGAAVTLMDRGQTMDSLLTAARTALEESDLDKAARAFQAILRMDASHVLARKGLAQVDGLLARRAEGAGILRQSSVRLTISREHASVLPLEPEEAFVMSRLSSTPVSVEALVSLTPVSVSELLDILRSFLSEGWIAVS